MIDMFGDQIRNLLVAGGASQDNAAKAALATQDIAQFQLQNPGDVDDPEYARRLGAALQSRGHTVNYT